MLIPIETVTQTVVILVLRLWIHIPHVFPSSLYLFMTSDCDNDENTRTEHWTLNTSVEKFLIRFSEHGQKLDNAWCNLDLILVVLAQIHIITFRQWCLLNHANSDWQWRRLLSSLYWGFEFIFHTYFRHPCICSWPVIVTMMKIQEQSTGRWTPVLRSSWLDFLNMVRNWTMLDVICLDSGCSCSDSHHNIPPVMSIEPC